MRIWAAVMMMWVAGAGGQTRVEFEVRSLTGTQGAVPGLNRMIVLEPRDPVTTDGVRFFAGTAIRLQPRDGYVATNIVPGNYTMRIEGVNAVWHLGVPESLATLNAAALSAAVPMVDSGGGGGGTNGLTAGQVTQIAQQVVAALAPVTNREARSIELREASVTNLVLGGVSRMEWPEGGGSRLTRRATS